MITTRGRLLVVSLLPRRWPRRASPGAVAGVSISGATKLGVTGCSVMVEGALSDGRPGRRTADDGTYAGVGLELVEPLGQVVCLNDSKVGLLPRGEDPDVVALHSPRRHPGGADQDLGGGH